MSMVAQLESFDKLDDLLGQLNAALINKSIFKWLIPEDFDALYTSLVRLTPEDDKSLVIATLGRVEATIKKTVFSVDGAVILSSTAPDLAEMKNGDDRYYTARFSRRLAPEWLYQWAMENVWAEPTSEKARLVLVEILIEKSSDFDSMLADLGKTGQTYFKVNKSVESKVTARFLRVVKCLRTACQGQDISWDINVGKSIDSFVGAPFTHFSPGQVKLNTRKNLVPEIIGLLLDLVGQRFSLAIESGHYTALKRIRKWCDDAAWRVLSEESLVLEKLSNTIAEAVLILARQNIADGELLERLKDSAIGNRNYILLCQHIAESGYLDESVAAWLRAGGESQQVKKTISSEIQLVTNSESADVGDLLRHLQEGQDAIDVIKDTLDDLELFDPALVPVVTNVANHWAIVDQITAKMANRLSVSLVGVRGEKVVIDRKLFDVSNEADVSRRDGNVVRPAIVILADGKTKVLKKGVVTIKD